MTVKKIMKTNVICITLEKTLADALKSLIKQNISGMPVVDNDNNLLGIITKSDIFKNTNKKTYELNNIRVKDMMVNQVCKLVPDDPIMKAVDYLNKHNISRLPIVQNEKVVGILTREDIIKYYVELKETGRSQCWRKIL